MESIAGSSLVILVIVVVLATATPGCIVIPMGNTETGSIEAPKLDSLIGSSKGQVLTKIGKPTHLFVSQKRGESYYLYEYDVSTRTFVGYLVPNPYVLVVPVGGQRTDEAGKLCYLLAFDADQSMVRYEIKDARPPQHPKDSQVESPLPNDPNADCQLYLWNPNELSGTTGIDLRKPIEDVTLLKELASAGDPIAAIELAKHTGDIAPLKKLAAEGNPILAYNAIQQIALNSQTLIEVWRWLCVDVNRGDGLAQQQMGFWYRTWVKKYVDPIELERAAEQTGVYPDKRIAYMWYTLAYTNGNVDALRIRGHIVRDERMTKGEIAQAEQMVRDWKPGDCPSVEHQLRPSDEA